MSTSKLLVVSCKYDPHVDVVIDKLNQLGFGSSVIRLNTEDFITNATLSITGSDARLGLRDSGREVRIDEIRLVWFRRPETPIVPQSVQPEVHDFILSQVNTALTGLYYLTLDQAVWINPRHTAAYSSNKIKQLQVARSVGFDVPSTLVTNNPDDASTFVHQHRETCIKSLDSSNPIADGHKYPFHTMKLTSEEKARYLPLVQACPTLFQEFIEKSFDLRVVVIGNKLFGVEIHSQVRRESREDFRLVSPFLLEHRVHSIPAKLQDKILTFMKYYDLRYSAMDFAVTEDNRYYFLENNPNGQWLWLEDLAAVPISQAFIEFILPVIETP